MDQHKFQEAQDLYAVGDYRAATKLFLAAAGKGVAGNGAAYHMAGNALMRLRRYPDATTVYGHALRDETYDKRGALHVNIGQALCAVADYARAADAFEAALAEPDYATPYKAWQGLGGAQLERGRIEDAAVAYRKAAIDPDNPNAGRALVNLGLCFMALERPADAAEAYKAALGVEQYQGRGKALANLGLAYVATGEYDEAVRAFEKAVRLHAHTLSESARAAYEQALAAQPAPAEKVEGWETGEMPHVLSAHPPQDGWATGELAGLAEPSPLRTTDPPAQSYDPLGAATLDPAAEAAASSLGFGDSEAVTTYFAMTEDEMRVKDRNDRRANREARRDVAFYVKRGAAAFAVVLVLGGAFAGAFWLGYGWPTQTKTVEGMLAAYQRGDDTAPFWVAVPEKDVDKEMAKVPPVKSFSVTESEQGPWASTIDVTITPEKGAPLFYKVMLAREGVGWKVIGIDNDWRSPDS